MNASPPRIESYRFGSITIEGETYAHDVIIRPEGVLAGWWREEGHSLCPEDLRDALDPKPDTLVIGCGASAVRQAHDGGVLSSSKGASGALRVPGETRRWIAEQGIELVALPTGEACDRYNDLAGAKRVVAGLHLTC